MHLLKVVIVGAHRPVEPIREAFGLGRDWRVLQAGTSVGAMPVQRVIVMPDALGVEHQDWFRYEVRMRLRPGCENNVVWL